MEEMKKRQLTAAILMGLMALSTSAYAAEQTDESDAHGRAQEVLTEENIAAMYGVATRVTVEEGAKHVRLLKDG